MKRSIWFWACFGATVILATYFAARIIMTTLGHGAAARVHSISISAAPRTTDLTAVAAAAAVAPGTHTYSVDLGAMAARIAATPGVRDAAVRRLPNGNLAVRVKLYQAVAQWTDGDMFFPLSADGTIVQRPGQRDAASVLFRGPVPNDITDITKAAHTMLGRLDYMEWVEKRRWNMHTTDGVTVMLPERGAVAAIAALRVLDEKHDILSRDIRIIDMRDDARILVK